MDFVDLSAPYAELYDFVFQVKYSKAQTFLRKVLSKCRKTETLYLRPNDSLDLILRNVYPNLRWIYLCDGDTSLDNDVLNESSPDQQKIVLINQEVMHIPMFVQYVNNMNKKCSFYFLGKDKSEKSLDICQFLSQNVKQLFLWQDDYHCEILVGKKFPNCPFLTHLWIQSRYFRLPVETVNALAVATAEGKLPKLSNVRLQTCAKIGMYNALFKSPLYSITHLEINDPVQGNDLLSLIESVLPRLESFSMQSFTTENPYQLLSKDPLTKLKYLRLKGGGKDDIFLLGINAGKIPNLCVLELLNNSTDLGIILTSERLPHLTALVIQRYECQGIESLLTHEIVVQLDKLDLSYCQLSTNLSYLLRRALPVLTSLTLCQCGLEKPDLQCLAQANVQDKLPQLRHLDVSYNTDGNCGNILENLFFQDCKWDKITSLNIESTHTKDDERVENGFNYLARMASWGCFPALQEIRFSLLEEFNVPGSKAKY